MAVSRTFVDTNVVVYRFDPADPRKQEIADAITPSAQGGPLVVSTQVLIELYSVLTRKLHATVSIEEAQAVIADFAGVPTVPTDAALVRTAVALSRSAQLSIWDAMIVAAAQAGRCTRLLTEDLSHGTTYGSVVVENPFLEAAPSA